MNPLSLLHTILTIATLITNPEKRILNFGEVGREAGGPGRIVAQNPTSGVLARLYVWYGTVYCQCAVPVPVPMMI